MFHSTGLIGRLVDQTAKLSDFILPLEVPWVISDENIYTELLDGTNSLNIEYNGRVQQLLLLFGISNEAQLITGTFHLPKHLTSDRHSISECALNELQSIRKEYRN